MREISICSLGVSFAAISICSLDVSFVVENNKRTGQNTIFSRRQKHASRIAREGTRLSILKWITAKSRKNKVFKL